MPPRIRVFGWNLLAAAGLVGKFPQHDARNFSGGSDSNPGALLVGYNFRTCCLWLDVL